MNQTNTVQQAVRSNVTRIATSQDVREVAVLLAQQNGKLAARLRNVEVLVDAINTKLDRLLVILQTLSRGTTE